MFPLLKARAEMRPIFDVCFRSLKTKMFNSKSPTKLFLLWNVNSFKHNFLFRNIQSKPATANEIVIYEHNNSKYFNKLKLLSTAQYVLWVLWGISSYDIARKRYLQAQQSSGDESRETERKMKLMMNIMVLSCVLGTVLIAIVWLFILRNVKCIKINESNRKFIFATYTPLLKDREFSVPIQDVSGVKGRRQCKMYVPLKIRNRIFHYLVDINGNFKDPSSFDSLVALKRDLTD